MVLLLLVLFFTFPAFAQSMDGKWDWTIFSITGIQEILVCRIGYPERNLAHSAREHRLGRKALTAFRVNLLKIPGWESGGQGGCNYVLSI